MRWRRAPFSKTEQFAESFFRGPRGLVYSVRWRVFRPRDSKRWSLALDGPDLCTIVSTGPDIGYLKRRADTAAYALGHMTKSETKRLARGWRRDEASDRRRV